MNLKIFLKMVSAIGGQYIEIFALKSDIDIIMLGIAISKKIAKSAKRNKIKRLVKENYRLIENELKTGFFIVVLWNKNQSYLNATFENIKKDMLGIFKDIGMVSEK